MSDGAKAWADELAEDRYKENNKKDTETLNAYVKGKEFKRLVALRKKYKELRELEQLEHNAQMIIKQCDCATGKWELESIIWNTGKEI